MPVYHSHHLIRSTSFSPTSRDDGPPRQQVLGPVDLRRLAEDASCRPAARSGRLATPRAGLAVTPLLPSEPPQLVPRMMCFAGSWHAPILVHPRQQLGDRLHAGLDRLADAAALLDGQHERLLLRPVERDQFQVLALDQVHRLPGLAAQADEDVRRRRSGAGRTRPACGRAAGGPAPSYCMAQPSLWMIGTTPSTFGYLSSRPDARTRSAMYLLVLAEQFTVLMIGDVVARAVAQVVRPVGRGRSP